MRRLAAKIICLVLAMALVLNWPVGTRAYSVLTHQAIIDYTWQDNIVPLLLKRYPSLSYDQLREANAYAYGGCIIQDLGYYPFSNKFFSDLLHYVRSGDFIVALLSEAQNANEYAFALGALAHYAADNNGHPIGTNRAVAIYYPKLRSQYGDSVTYEQHPTAHVQAEFGFDVLQVARGHYAPEAYHDFIGFKVSKPVLDRALIKTYGLGLKDFFFNVDLAINTYRRAVSKTIPFMTKVAWETKKEELMMLAQVDRRDKFVYKFSGQEFEREFGDEYKKPSFGQKALALFIKILPKFGLLKALEFKAPTPETERLFIDSLDRTVAHYRALLSRSDDKEFRLEDRIFDTGLPTRAGQYRLADKAYLKLLERLDKRDFKNVSPALRQDINNYFADPSALLPLRADKKKMRKTMERLSKLEKL